MADIFISYKSERKAAARHLDQILTRYGYSVWYDHALQRGDDYESQIQREIRAAKAVVVVWCAQSVESGAVRSEAAYAKGEGKLIPLKIEPCVLPLFSTLDQHIDLTRASCAPRVPFAAPANNRAISRRAKTWRWPACSADSLWRIPAWGRCMVSPPRSAGCFPRPMEPCARRCCRTQWR